MSLSRENTAEQRKKIRVLIQMGDPYRIENPCTKRMSTIYSELKKNGHDVRILAPVGIGSDFSCSDVIHCRTVIMRKKTTLFRFLNSAVFAFTSFVKAFSLGKFDIVITTSPPPLINISGWLMAVFKHARLVYDVRDIWPDVAWEMGSMDRKGLYSRIFEMLRDFMLSHSDLVTAVSKGKAEKLREYAPGADVVEIPNGFDENFLNNSENMEIVRRYELDTKFSCVYVGNLGKAQGLMQLLQIAERAKNAQLRDVQFLLFGSGLEEKELKTRAEDRCLENVIFPGSLPNSDIYTILKHAGLSFVPLVNKNLKDSVPTKLYEALGAGCPVLLAASGDSVDILEECRLGRAVMPNDEEALWEAFQDMYLNRREYEAGKKYAERVILEKYSRQKAAELLRIELERITGC